MSKPRFEVAVGLFVVVGFLVLSIIVFFVSGIYFFRPGYHLSAHFDFVGIIDRGAPVRFSGVRVGEVSRVRILKPTDEQGKARVEVTFFVEKKIEVRERYEVSIQGTHIMSEPHIEITPVADGGRILKDGDVVLNGVSPFSLEDLIKRGDSISKRFDELLQNAGEVFGSPETRQMLRQSLENMNRLLASMNAITEGQEKEFRALTVNLSHTTEQMAELLKRVNQGEGTLGKLISEDEVYNDLRDFMRDIKKNPWRLLKKG